MMSRQLVKSFSKKILSISSIILTFFVFKSFFIFAWFAQIFLFLNLFGDCRIVQHTGSLYSQQSRISYCFSQTRNVHRFHERWPSTAGSYCWSGKEWISRLVYYNYTLVALPCTYSVSLYLWIFQALKEDSVFFVTSKRSTIDKCRLPVGIRLFVSAAHSDSDLLKASESLKRVSASVLTNQ